MVTAKRHRWGVQTISAVCFCGGGLVLTDWLSEGQKLFGFTLAVFPSESDVCRPAWALWRYFFYRRAVMRLNWATGHMTDAPRLHFNQSSSVIHAALTLAQLFYCQRSFGQKSPKSNKMFYRPGSVPINQALHACSNTLKSKPNQLQEPAVRLGTRNYTIMQMWGRSERKHWREITWRYHLCMSNRGGEPGEQLKLPCWEGKDWTRAATVHQVTRTIRLD